MAGLGRGENAAHLAHVGERIDGKRVWPAIRTRSAELNEAHAEWPRPLGELVRRLNAVVPLPGPRKGGAKSIDPFFFSQSKRTRERKGGYRNLVVEIDPWSGSTR